MAEKRDKKSEYKCPSCRDTGWVSREKDGVRRSRRCPDCGQKKIVSRLLYDAGIPARYSGMDFKIFNHGDRSQSEAVTRALDFMEKYPGGERGLLFVGPCGVGKTHLSVSLLKDLIVEKMVKGLFVDEADLLSRLQHSYNPDTIETEGRILERLKEADLLVWDDLGTGRPTEWAKSKVSEVINHRYTHCKRTIMSSNYPMQGRLSKLYKPGSGETLEERLGIRLFSRVMEMCEIVEIVGADFRIDGHKARLDFQVNNYRPGDHSSLIPEGARICPGCSEGEIMIGISEKVNVKGRGPAIRFSGICSECGRECAGQFDIKAGKVEFF